MIAGWFAVLLLLGGGSVAGPCTDVRSEMERAHPDQIAPEPLQPGVECRFVREVRCVPPSPTTAAWQMDPFSGCPRGIARWSQDLYGDHPQFSRKETRRERMGSDGVATCAPTPSSGKCCYVQFSTQVCR